MKHFTSKYLTGSTQSVSYRNRLRSSIQIFLRDERGTNAIEFAIVAPFLITLLLGVLWITDTERVSTQASLVSSTVSDIIARSATVNDDFIEKTLFAADAMMGSQADNLQVYVAGIENTVVSYNPDGTANYSPVVIWVRKKNIDDMIVPAVGDVYPLKESLVDNVPFVVSSRVRIKHTPVLGPQIMGEQVYEYEHTFAPRADLKTDCTDC